VEPQSYKEEAFNRRMFKYFARLHEKYGFKVLPIAVYAHGLKEKEPSSYEMHFPFFQVLGFNFLQLHLKRLSWREFLKKDNPAVAALLSHMDYGKKERIRLKLEFLKMLLRLKLDPARMQLLSGFFDSYVQLEPEEDKKLQEKLAQEIPEEEVIEVTEILTSWHKRGIEEGKVEALQNAVARLAGKKLGGLSTETKEMIFSLTSIEQLENICDSILDIQTEKELLEMLRKEK